ncbi:MAG: hypothetical protein OEZ29_06100 [Candidatus Bathyarchaeota archaeon]|nr:hypothetical protein [Candidatus Bathyarchaeota archaeon]MDH5780149.1 hypothetical protein [Candidatus Bathyarchaeota archaeon]
MADEGNLKSVLKKIMSNVTKAALKGFIMFLLTYLLPTLVVEAMVPSSSPFGIPSEYTTLLYVFSAIVVFFTVVTELFSGTILQHAFCVGRAIVLIVYFVYALNGGIFVSAFQIPGQQQVLRIFANLRAFLALLIFINLLGFAKGMLQAINFLSGRADLK